MLQILTDVIMAQSVRFDHVRGYGKLQMIEVTQGEGAGLRVRTNVIVCVSLC